MSFPVLEAVSGQHEAPTSGQTRRKRDHMRSTEPIFGGPDLSALKLEVPCSLAHRKPHARLPARNDVCARWRACCPWDYTLSRRTTKRRYPSGFLGTLGRSIWVVVDLNAIHVRGIQENGATAFLPF